MSSQEGTEREKGEKECYEHRWVHMPVLNLLPVPRSDMCENVITETSLQRISASLTADMKHQETLDRLWMAQREYNN